MNLLFLTYYFEPDLSAGSFRNTPLAYELARQIGDSGTVHVITTQPNRYSSFRVEALPTEQHGNLQIDRVSVPEHTSGFADQIKSYVQFYRQALTLTRTETYDVVVASSSRLFSAFLGAYLARQRKIPLILDIRDLFRENILEVFKNPVARLGLAPTLKAVEKYTFSYASHINLVSEGFGDYFSGYPQATYSYFTNGIDAPFLHLTARAGQGGAGVRTVLYAGNIGEGQGLEKIIPDAAKQLGSGFRFVVIGDGSSKHKLEKAVADARLTNVAVRPPMNRATLLAEYEQADYLLLHLNNLRAFERCLPSKLFEYAATDKPVLAGVAGYAARFVRQHIPNSFVFSPGDTAELARYLQTTPYHTEARPAFIAQFGRPSITQSLASQILKTVGVKREEGVKNV